MDLPCHLLNARSSLKSVAQHSDPRKTSCYVPTVSLPRRRWYDKRACFLDCKRMAVRCTGSCRCQQQRGSRNAAHRRQQWTMSFQLLRCILHLRLSWSTFSSTSSCAGPTPFGCTSLQLRFVCLGDCRALSPANPTEMVNDASHDICHGNSDTDLNRLLAVASLRFDAAKNAAHKVSHWCVAVSAHSHAGRGVLSPVTASYAAPAPVVYMYPALAAHAAPGPAVEYVSPEFKRSTQVGGTRPGHRTGDVCLHLFFEKQLMLRIDCAQNRS